MLHPFVDGLFFAATTNDFPRKKAFNSSHTEMKKVLFLALIDVQGVEQPGKVVVEGLKMLQENSLQRGHHPMHYGLRVEI